MQKTIGGNPSKKSFAVEPYKGQSRVLEIGCSVGNVSEAFLKYPNISFTGIDIDDRAIALAQRRFQSFPRFNFRHISLEALAKSGERFDYILFAGILHHVDDITASTLLKDAMSCANHNATLVISEPEALRKDDNWGFRMYYRLEQGCYLRSKAELIALTQRSGISLDSVEERMMSPGIFSQPHVMRFNLLVGRSST